MTRGRWHRLAPGAYKARALDDGGRVITFCIEQVGAEWWLTVFHRRRTVTSATAHTLYEAKRLAEGWTP